MISSSLGNLRRGIIIAGACALLAGCSVLSSAEAELDTYDFSAPTDFSKVRGATGAQVLVKAPSSLKVLDIDRIVVRKAGNEVTYLPDVRLADALPTVLQVKLAETFVNSEKFRAVGKPGDGLLIDYQLIIDLRAFELRTKGNGLEAYGEMSVKLVNDRNGRVTSSRVFEASRAAVSTGSEAIEALDDVFDRLALDMTAWIVSRI
jgi:cholesterol transport system auxiliary component